MELFSTHENFLFFYLPFDLQLLALTLFQLVGDQVSCNIKEQSTNGRMVYVKV